MKITAVNPVPVAQPNSQPAAAQDARARAIARLMNNSAPTDAPPVEIPDAQVAPGGLDALSTSKDTVETLAAEVPATPAKAKEDPLSSQYATLARKEKALRAQIQQFKEERSRFESERQAQPKQPDFDVSKYIERERLKADPLSALEESGMSYDDIVSSALQRSQIQTDPRLTAQINQMKAEIQAARDELKASREAQENNQKQSYQQAVKQIKDDASKLVFTDPAYEMIKATNSVNDVVELIEETFKTDGNLMTIEEACQAVEDHLLEEAMKLTKVKKLQQRLGQSTAQPPVKDTKQPQTQKTLTNTMSASKPMSARDRAIARMQGKLTI